MLPECVLDEPEEIAPEMDASVAELRALAIRGLPGMFDAEAGLFAFRVRRDGDKVLREGLSRRYTAITLVGLAGEAPEVARRVLAGKSVREIAEALIRDASTFEPGSPPTPGLERVGEAAIAAFGKDTALLLLAGLGPPDGDTCSIA